MSKERTLSNGDKLFPLGFGAMRLPTKNNSIDTDVACEMLYYTIDKGVNFIDTAYSYHGGESESFLGNALNRYDSDGEKYRDKVKLSTKLPTWLVKTPEDMDAFLNGQLKKLQTDCIDYYFLHTVNLTTLKRLESIGIFEFLDKAKEDGRIKNAGFSYHGSKYEFNEVVDSYDWDMCLLLYNYMDTNIQAGSDGVKYAYSKRLDIFVMEPLKGGVLARNLPQKAEDLLHNIDSTRSNADWALSWVLNQKEIACVLSGMGDLEQVKENIAIADSVDINSLTNTELDAINQVKDIMNSLLKIECSSCGYCLPCPKGVNIPECFSVYNDKYLFNLKAFGPIPLALIKYYMLVGGIMNKPAYAGLCNQCGRCRKFCPQFIDIPKELKQVSKEFEGHGFKYKVNFIKKVGMPLFDKINKIFDF